MTKFKIDLNLDDEEECKEFVKRWHPGMHKRAQAVELGFTGPGSQSAAHSLFLYAMNRLPAFDARRRGMIGRACNLEECCDRIYKREIQPHIECW